MSRKLNSQTSVDQLEERLKKLKEEESTVGSCSEKASIEERLARLKGIDPKVYTAPPITVYQLPKKSDTQQADDLMRQYVDEVGIDEKTDNRRQSTDEEIRERLERLKGDEMVSSTTAAAAADIDSDAEEGEDEVVTRILAESHLPPVPGENPAQRTGGAEENIDIGDEELPWCVICNEDAAVRCFGCGDDLYCRQCFRDFHDEPDLRKHKTAPFKKPKTKIY